MKQFKNKSNILEKGIFITNVLDVFQKINVIIKKPSFEYNKL